MSESLSDQAMLMLEIGVSAKPDEMVEPDEAILTFTISNISDMDVLNLYLSSADGRISESIGQIAAGDTQTFSRSHSVSDEELAAGEICYIISHDAPLEGDDRVDYTIRAAISRATAQPQAEFTRQFSSRCAAAGNMISIAYRVRNSGNVALNDLQIRDSLGDFSGRIDRLEIGESRTLINRAVIETSGASSAVLSYRADTLGDAQYSQSLADVEVYLAEAQIDAMLSAAYGAFSEDTADVVLVLTNEGNVDYRDITISDDIYGGVITDNVRLSSGGDPVEVTATYPLREESVFRWRISGASETGERIDFVTDTITLEPISSTEPSELRVWTEVETPRIRRSGNVKMIIHIANDGNSAVENIVLREPLLGEIRTFAVIPSAGEIQREVNVFVEEDSEYLFSVDYTDADGWQRSAQSNSAEIIIASDGVLPEGSRIPLIEFTGKSIKIGGSSLFGILLIAAFTVLMVLIIILLIATRRAKLEKRLRIAAEKQRRKEELGRTNPFKPVRRQSRGDDAPNKKK